MDPIGTEIDVTLFPKMVWVRDLVLAEISIFSLYKSDESEDSDHYLWFWVGASGDADRWVVTRWAKEDFARLDDLTPREVYHLNPSVWIVDWKDGFKRVATCPLSDVPKKYLPSKKAKWD